MPPRDRDHPIARWLRETRLRQRMADDPGQPWEVEYFLPRMAESTGWAPGRTNYSAYENGRTIPKRETLAKFVAFWAAQGEPGPELDPEPEADPPTESESLIAAMLDQTAAMRAHTAEMTAQTAAMMAQAAASAALVNRLDQLLPSERIREMVAWAAANMPSSPSPDPIPGPSGSRERR